MSNPECSCDETDELGYAHCPIHVHCDSSCKAPLDPVTLDEYKAALAHWEGHGYLSGCSHGY